MMFSHVNDDYFFQTYSKRHIFKWYDLMQGFLKRPKNDSWCWRVKYMSSEFSCRSWRPQRTHSRHHAVKLQQILPSSREISPSASRNPRLLAMKEIESGKHLKHLKRHCWLVKASGKHLKLFWEKKDPQVFFGKHCWFFGNIFAADLFLGNIRKKTSLRKKPCPRWRWQQQARGFALPHHAVICLGQWDHQTTVFVIISLIDIDMNL